MMDTMGMASVITPVYQPVIDLQSGAPLYFESLARASSAKNHVALLQFAEQYGFIHLLDGAMIELAAQALIRQPDLRMGVNVSVATVEQWTGPLVCAIYRHLQVASRLVVEITETVAISDVTKIRTFMDAARASGATVAFDDVGAGYFTCDHIKDLRPQMIKLDGQLFAERVERAAEIDRLLSIARACGMEVIAEAIDSEDKRRDCAELGIRYGQGFMLGGVSSTPSVAGTTNVVDYRRARVAGHRVMVRADGLTTGETIP